MAITLALDSLAWILLYVSTIEFFVSQTPYSITNAILYKRTQFWSWIWKCVHIHYHRVWYLLAIHSSFNKLWPRSHQLWILVSTFDTTNNNSFQWPTSYCWKVVQEQKERRCATKSTHLRWEILCTIAMTSPIHWLFNLAFIRFHFLPTPYTIMCQFTITHTRQVKDKYFIQLHYFVIDRGINHLTNHALL